MKNTDGILILSILVGAHPTEFEANLCSSLEEVEEVKNVHDDIDDGHRMIARVTLSH